MKFPLKRECNTTFDVTITGLTFSLKQRAPSRDSTQALPIFRADNFFNVLFHRKINISSITRVRSVFLLRERERAREREREREREFRKYTSC